MSRQTLTIKEGRQRKRGKKERKWQNMPRDIQRNKRLTTFFVTLFLLRKELKQCPV